MRIKILGSAAGGGFPQWNCSCSNCRRILQGTFHGTPRTQAQIAFSPDSKVLVPGRRVTRSAEPRFSPRPELLPNHKDATHLANRRRIPPVRRRRLADGPAPPPRISILLHLCHSLRFNASSKKKIRFSAYSIAPIHRSSGKRFQAKAASAVIYRKAPAKPRHSSAPRFRWETHTLTMSAKS